jgi:hypothetical protein
VNNATRKSLSAPDETVVLGSITKFVETTDELDVAEGEAFFWGPRMEMKSLDDLQSKMLKNELQEAYGKGTVMSGVAPKIVGTHQ